MTAMNDPIFHDDGAARAHLEAIRWTNGIVCPHCGNINQATIAKVEGRKKTHRPGLYYCNACKGQFTVTVGTVMERSKIALHKWVLAFHLYASSKKGMSAHQLHRMLGISYKSAWFMSHRIREAMRVGDLAPMGSNGGAVEVDETFIGKEPGKPKTKNARSYHHKMKVLSLVDRTTGEVRSVVIDTISAKSIVPVLNANIAKEARLMTDELKVYVAPGREFAEHGTVEHGKGEYVRGDVHTNTLEGFFSIFKRGMKGIYQHCGKQHLHRYVAEFDFRYTNRIANGVDDTARAARILKGAAGKRLTYRRTDARTSV